MGLMYGTYDWYYHRLVFYVRGHSEDRPATEIKFNEPHLEVRAIAAILSGSTEGLLAPFERIQTLLQHRHYTNQFANSWDAARQLSRYGIPEYYRGVSAILLRNGPANTIFFLLRDSVRDLLPPINVDDNRPTHPHMGWEFMRNFFSGAVLGATISTVFYPLNIVKGVMQLQIGGPHHGVVHTFRQVLRDRSGWGGMYRGVTGNAMRSLLSWGITNSSYELYKKLIV
jgi:hypothetical protein